MRRECELGNHEYRPVNNWWECAWCGISNNFAPTLGTVAKEVNSLRDKVKALESKLAEYEKVEAAPADLPFVGSQTVESIIDLLAGYYPVPVAGKTYAIHLKRQFSKLRRELDDAETSDSAEQMRAEGWKADGACDACGGMGGIVDCMCQGTGRAKDAVIYLRKEVYRLQDMLLRRDQYKPAINIELLHNWLRCRYMHGDSPCMKCGFPGWDHLPLLQYEGYQAKYPGDCGFYGVCENCKAGRT